MVGSPERAHGPRLDRRTPLCRPRVAPPRCLRPPGASAGPPPAPDLRRRLLSPGLVPALRFAVAVWLVAGAVVMPLMGALAGPAAPADAMRGSFMMLHLGPLAAVSALIGRLLYGAVLGSSTSMRMVGT